jgi:hypothetical protein
MIVARDRKIDIAGLNVVTHPHSVEIYINLLKEAFSLKKVVHVRSVHKAMIGELRYINKDYPMSGLVGRIYRFIHFDPNEPWFNVEKHEAATPDEMAELKIPTNMKPGMSIFDFVFYPKNHKLYYITNDKTSKLAPHSMKSIFDNIFSDKRLIERFGTVEVTVLPDQEQLDTILKIPYMSSLIIEVTRPNPDDFGVEEQRVLERLNNQGARKIKEILTATSQDTLNPDEQTRTLARVASQNGSVSVTGLDAGGKRLEMSTQQHPWKESVTYNPELQLANEALLTWTSDTHET